MKSKLLLLMLMSVFSIFLAGAVSAACSGTATLCGSVISPSDPSTAPPNSDITITFNVTYEGTASPPITLSFSESITKINIGTWKTLPSSTTPINKGEPITLSAVLNVPEHATGVINPIIIAKTNTGSIASINVPVITINNAPALLLTADKSEITAEENVALTVKNTGNVPLNVVLASSGGFSMTITPPYNLPFSLIAGEEIKNIAATPVDLSKLEFGDYTSTITAKDSTTGIQSNVSVAFTKSFCKIGEVGGNLSITRARINSDGLDEKEWRPFDTITITVDVKNEGSDRVDDVVVELGLFDSAGNDQSGDLDFINEGDEKYDIGNIGEGDKEKATFEFKISPDLAKEDYRLAIKAYSEDLEEDTECTSESGDLNNDFYQDIEVLREDDEGKFIVFDNIEISPSGDATCGDQISVTADVFNIGDEDQDYVKIILVNPQLKVKEEKIIRDLTEGDSTRVSFSFAVPKDAEDKTYSLEFNAEYDYRSGTYRESSDTSASFALKVIGCSAVPSQGNNIAIITAVPETSAKEGEDFIVKSTITSLLSQEADFVINAAGFDSWAELSSISNRLIRLKSGESKEVLLTFKIKDDATGAQSFTIDAISGGNTQTQEVQANIESGSATQGLGLGGNNLIWVIGIINVVLIILIIVVAVRISRK